MNGIQLEVLWRRLISVVDEAAASLVRTSFSSIVRESNDFACVVTDAQGWSIAQASKSIPSFIGTAPQTIRCFIERFPPDTLEDGDVLITNDCWLGTGHLPDITVAKPIMVDGRLIAWAGSVAHAPDIGGRVRSADATSVFEEGLQIPPMKVLRAGQIDRTLEAILRQNVRVPDQVMGDLYAQFTGLTLIERHIRELMEEYSLHSFDELSSQLRARTEAAMRSAIKAVPDGVYRSEAISDGIGGEQPIRLRMALTVEGDSIRVDFSGTDAQVQNSINVCLTYTKAFTAYGIKSVLCADIPNNDGVLVPLDITAPYRSILNSAPPAAGGARALIGHFLPAMVVEALAAVVPDKVIAGVGSPLWCVNVAGTRPDGKGFANLFFLNGGYGASSRGDGINVISWPSNISSTPVEVIEQLVPLKVHCRQFRRMSEPNGRYRGGLGQELILESLCPTPVVMSFMAERTRAESAARGMAGGRSGEPGEILLDGRKINPKQQQIVHQGATVTLRTPMGGGYGAPSLRSNALIEEDRANGLYAQ